jgi:hypothetical protein
MISFSLNVLLIYMCHIDNKEDHVCYEWEEDSVKDLPEELLPQE